MKRFNVITETEARLLEIGSTVELLPGGQITPLARDTLNARRITVQRADGVETGAGADLAPPAEVRIIAVGADHAGVALKQELLRHLRSQGRTAHDLGTRGPDRVDYPDVAAAVARAVACGEVDAGIVIDGGGIGSAIAANKIAGIRAAMATDERTARYSRAHNGANVLTLGATLVDVEQACAIVDAWIATPMREPRYIKRLAKIRRLEQR